MPDFVLRKSGKKGKGVFAAKDFRKGEYVAFLTGPVRKRRTPYTVQTGQKIHVYPKPPGGTVFRFANHSCSPNCGIGISKDFRAGLRAMRNIRAGEEITWDYAMTEDRFDYRMPCRCKSKNCRKMIDGYRSLDKKTRKRYRNYVMPYLRKLE